jgi:hypothetical protein
VTVSSVMVFHSPQVSHRPAHFVVTAPQDWQTNRETGFAMAGDHGLAQFTRPLCSSQFARLRIRPAALTSVLLLVAISRLLVGISRLRSFGRLPLVLVHLVARNASSDRAKHTMVHHVAGESASGAAAETPDGVSWRAAADPYPGNCGKGCDSADLHRSQSPSG